MGELYVSASEIETYDLCSRKWAFQYIEQKRGPPNDAAALGTRVHAILEKWLKEGTAPDTWTDEGEIAASGLHLLPRPRYPGLVTEEEFRFTSRRAWFMGYKDFKYRDSTGLLHVGDHKTTKSFQWAKSLEEILCHQQALIYAVDEFHRNPNDNCLSLDWIYYRTTGARKAESRFQIVTRDEVAELFFEHVDPIAGEITRLHHETPTGASALDFTPDFRACDAFGGCAFLSICNPTPTQRVQATMTQAGMSLTDKLKAMKAARPASPIHPPEYQAAPVPAFVAPQAVQPPLPFPTAAQPVGVPAQAFAVPGGVVEASTASVPAYVPSPAALAPPFVPAPPVALVAPLPAPQAAPGPQAPLHVVPVPEAAPKPRGRPKKAPAAVVPAEAPQVGLVEAGFVLYIGCAPIGVAVSKALDYVNAAHDQLKESTGISYRQMQYGVGPSELCKALEGVLDYCAVTDALNGDILLGDTQIEEDTASVWISKASKVVRAFR